MLTLLLTFPFPVSCLKGGLAPPFSSTLLFSKVRMVTDCFPHCLSACPHLFLSLLFPSSFSMHLLSLCILLFISPLWLCPVPQLSLSPFLSCQPWVCLALSGPRSNLCSRGSADAPMPSHFCQHTGIWALVSFASFYFGVSLFNNYCV